MISFDISDKKFYKAIVFWWAFWWIGLFLVNRNYGFDFIESLVDSSLYISLLALAGYEISLLVKFYAHNSKSRYYLFLAGIGLAVLINQIHLPLFENIIKEKLNFVNFLSIHQWLRFGFSLLMIEFVMLINWIYFYLKEQQRRENHDLETQKLAKENELAKIRHQLQPHFLFNSLNSINALIGTKPEKAREMVLQLSDFLRGTIKRTDNQIVTFNEELELLLLYLSIEKVRFGNRLQTQFIQNEEVLDCKIPAMILQPLVENAIKFGLYDNLDEVIISIKAELENNYLVLKISNPFDKDTAKTNTGTGFGLSSVFQRFKLIYNREDLLRFKTQDNIFTVTLKIPQL